MVTFCTYYIAWILGDEGRGENGDCSRSVVRTVSTGCETPQCAASWMLLLYARDSSRWLLTPSPQFLSRGAQTFWHRARAYRALAWMMVSTTAGGRPLKSATSRPGATHGGSIDLDAGAIWCRAPEKGGPSSGECAREVLSRGKWVRETRSGWANGAQPAGPAPRPPWACTVSVRVGSLGETHTCVRPEASCVPVRLCRGGPRSGRSTAGSGRTRGRQTGLPELPRIDSRSAGSSRDGVATLRGTWAVVRARRPHDWAAPGCEQHAVTWTACDSRGGDGGRAVTCGVIVYPPAGWYNSGSSALLEHVPPWGVPSYSPSLTPHREKRFSAQGRACSFPSRPEAPTGWGAGAPSPCDRPTALWIGLE